MGIAAGDESHADFKPPCKFALLRFIESTKQPPAAIGAIDAHGTIDITLVGAKRFTFKLGPIVRLEHLRDDRRAMVEFVAECAKKRDDSAIDRSDSRSEILRYLGNLPGCKFGRKKPLLPVL
jgi:hypothetical protein